MSLCRRRKEDCHSPRRLSIMVSELRYSTRAKVLAADGGQLLQVRFLSHAPQECGEEKEKRGVIRGFSPCSRRRFQRRLAQVSVTAELPEFVTLTFPDSVLMDWRPESGRWKFHAFCQQAKVHLQNFFKVLKRELPGASGFWRMEFVERKSGVYVGMWVPHFHLLVFGVPNIDEQVNEKGELETVKGWTARGLCARQTYWNFQLALLGLSGKAKQGESSTSLSGVVPIVRDDVEWFHWLSLAWYNVVDSHDMDHARAGTQSSTVRSWGGVWCYSSKMYMCKDSDPSRSPYGRHWGIFNRGAIPWAKMIELDLTGAEGYRLRRVMRRYLERSRGRSYTVRNGCGMTLYCRDAGLWLSRLVNAPPECPF